jgi:restriction endonuclease S subunit
MSERLPSGWKQDRLDAVAELERATVLPQDIREGTKYVGLEHIDSSGAFLDVPKVGQGELASNKFAFSAQHVLYGKLRPYLTKIARPGFVGVCSTEIIPIRTNGRVNRDYLYFYLRQPRMVALANARTAGANLPRLSPTDLASFPITYPESPTEQRRIADILDEADALRRKRAEAIRLANNLVPSLFYEMFGDPVSNPKQWPTRHVSSLCELVRGSSPRPKGDPRYYGGSVPRLMVEDVTRDGWVVTPTIDSLTEEGARLSRPVPEGTIVMAVSGNVGVVSRLAIDACVHDGFVALTELDEEQVNPDYMLFCLHSLKATHANREAGAIFKNLTTHQVKAMDIALPPMTLQLVFAERWDEVRQVESRVKLSASVLDNLFHSLLQRAFQGEL